MFLLLWLALASFYVAIGMFGFFGFLGWMGAFGIVLGVFGAIDGRQRRLKDEAARAVPCRHGVGGAVVDQSRCKECLAEGRERQEAETARRERELAAKRAQWFEKIRLPEYLKQMHPQEFEDLVCQLFTGLGYEVEATRYAGDGGVDAYARKDGSLAVIQCKRVKGSVGEPVLRDLYGAMHAAGAKSAFVVTTGRVSPQARRWIEGKPISIIELKELETLIRDNLSEESVVPPTFRPMGAASIKSCPRCGNRLKIVRGRHGRFFGCSAYPHCRYSRSARSRR